MPTTIGEGHAYSAVEATASGNSPDGVTLVLISFASIVLISFASIVLISFAVVAEMLM